MSQSWQTAVYGSTDNWSSNKILIGVTDCDLLGNRVFDVAQGKSQTREMTKCRAAQMGETVSGGFSLFPTSAELDWLLTNALGWGSSSPWTPSSSLSSINLWADKGDLQTYKYTGCRLNRLMLSGQEFQFLKARCDFIGESETEVTDLTTTGVTIDCANCFPFKDIVLTIGGTAFKLKQFDLTIDQGIPAQQQENNATRTVFEAGMLTVGLNVTVGFRSDTKALYRKAVAGDDSCTLSWTDGTYTYTATFGNLKIPGNGPTVPENGEITMVPQIQAYRSGSAPVISIAKA